MSVLGGGCLCSAVRFTAQDVQTEHHVCHCRMCRRWAGSSFMAVSAGQVSFEGEENVSRYPSSEWAERGFCSRCGSSLFYYLKSPATYMLSVGSFDDQEPFRLVSEIYIDHKPVGFAFEGDLPAMTEAEVIAKFFPPDTE